MRSATAAIVCLGLLGAFPLVARAQTTAGTPALTSNTTLGGQTIGGTTTNSGGGSGGTPGGNDPITSTTFKGPRANAGSTTSIPSSTNPFAATYIDYLALGKPSLYPKETVIGLAPVQITTSTFGQPIYGTTATKAGVGGGGQGTGQSQNIGFSTVGQIRNPAYITGLSSEMKYKVHTPVTILADARAVINQSSYINSKIDVSVVSGAIVLRGIVGTEKERRIAETTLRVTPGIGEVRNFIVVDERLAR